MYSTRKSTPLSIAVSASTGALTRCMLIPTALIAVSSPVRVSSVKVTTAPIRHEMGRMMGSLIGTKYLKYSNSNDSGCWVRRRESTRFLDSTRA